MVELVNVEDAVKAKKNLNGTMIYAGCCNLRVEYGKADKLVVRKSKLLSFRKIGTMSSLKLIVTL